MQALIERAGLQDRIRCDSAGTLSYHSGDPPDPRMSQAAEVRGYILHGRARKASLKDLRNFDLIVAMDRENLEDLRSMDLEGSHRDKIVAICDYCRVHDALEVPDPYYGGERGFEHVVSLLEDACGGLLEHLCNRWQLRPRAQGEAVE